MEVEQNRYQIDLLLDFCEYISTVFNRLCLWLKCFVKCSVFAIKFHTNIKYKKIASI